MSRKLGIRAIDPYRCINCLVCVRSCMGDVIRAKRGKPYIAYGNDCCYCLSCEIDCPRDAISIGWVEVEE